MRAVEGILSLDPRGAFRPRPPTPVEPPEGDGVVEEEEAPEDVEAIFFGIPMVFEDRYAKLLAVEVAGN